ncbi:MAG: helix-turn-helix domain-containing protein [Candidatus Solibacter sp.]|jgi:AraC-like DNA-binding protein
MTFVQRTPAPPLDSFVECVWFCRNARRAIMFERVLPTGGPQLIVNLGEDETRVYENTARGLHCQSSPGSILTGITTRAHIIDTAEQEYVAGIAFRPGGTVPFFAAPAFELSDTDTPVAVLWGTRSEARLREQLLAASNPNEILDTLETSLLAAWRDSVVHPAVTFAIEVFQSQPQVVRIDSVADAVGLSAKRFIERFKAEVGVTPKRFCRLLRFQRAVKQAHRAVPVDWTLLALECGYFDQAHFIHEFRQFSGLAPGEYRAAATVFANHVNFVQSSEREVV